MGTIATIAVALRADTQNFERGMKKAEASVIKFREGFSKIGGALKGAAAAGISSVSSELGLLGDALQGATSGFAVAGPWGAVAGAIGSVGIAAYKSSKQVKDLGKGMDEVAQAMDREAKKLAVFNEVFNIPSEMEEYRNELIAIRDLELELSAPRTMNTMVWNPQEQGISNRSFDDIAGIKRDIFGDITKQIGSIQGGIGPIIESTKEWQKQTDALKKSMDEIDNSWTRFADGIKEEIKSPLEKFQDDLLRLQGALQQNKLTPEQFDKAANLYRDKFEKSLNIDTALKNNGQAGVITSGRVSVEGLARGQSSKTQKVESEQLTQANALLAQLLSEVRGSDGVTRLG